MRELTSHKVNGCNEAIRITTADEPEPATAARALGANHAYEVEWPGQTLSIRFQSGPINEVGTNGVTHEALIAIIIDRVQSFQRGPFACRENALALTKLEEAMHWLHHRTRERSARGVEGTHQK